MRKKVKKPAITLTELLAINRTADCRRLLKQHGIPDATNYGDLQNKLVQLYSTATDKRELEQQIAAMHPHKDFILKYFAPVKEEIKVQPVTESNAAAKVIANDWSGNEGNRGDNQKYLYACGCGAHSGFDGTGPARNRLNVAQDNTVLIIGIVAIVAITGFLIHHQHAKH